MKIVSEDLASSLDIEITGAEAVYPSLMLSVSVTDEEFAGACGEVWVLAEDLDKFAADLRNCEQVRKGSASLLSMSPDELKLVIAPSDGWGHFVLRYTIGRTSYASRTILTKTVCDGLT